MVQADQDWPEFGLPGFGAQEGIRIQKGGPLSGAGNTYGMIGPQFCKALNRVIRDPKIT